MRAAARRLRRRLAGEDSRPAAVYARVLDGDHLWLAVEGVTAEDELALDVPGGPVPLVPESVRALDGPRAGVALCADLLGLPLPPAGAGDEWTARLLATAPGAGPGVGGVPVALPEAPDEDATTTPRSSAGWWQHAVLQGPDGELLLRRTGHAPWAEVLGLDADDDRLWATLLLPDEPAPAGAGPVPVAALQDASGTELCRLPDTGPGTGAGRLVLAVPPDVPVPVGTGARVVLRDTPDSVPVLVRRRRHELVYPDASVALPGIVEADDVKPLLRWRWFPDGTLAVQRPRPSRYAPAVEATP